jgi:hypothetical protein
MVSPHESVRRKAVNNGGSVTPTDSAYPHERCDVESGTSRNGIGGLDEKYSQFREISLSPQNSNLEGTAEELPKTGKLSLFFAKYKIFFHAFLWLLFTG